MTKPHATIRSFVMFGKLIAAVALVLAASGCAGTGRRDMGAGAKSDERRTAGFVALPGLTARRTQEFKHPSTAQEPYHMATYYPSITDEQAELIRGAALFFVATADPQLASGPNEVGPVNVSPKGGVPLHILGPNRVAYLDYRGSGNETARHCTAGGPITVMVCAFDDEDAAIVRLFGTARVTSLEESPLAAVLLAQPAAELKGKAR